MRFVITGGGTGGHIYPALAIARGLQQKYPGGKILYVGTDRGLEAEIVPKAGLAFRTIRVAGLKRSLSPANLAVLWQTAAGLAGAARILRSFRPAAVVGTGGYVCGPVVLAAAGLRIPTLIHEQNALPGITNRILARIAGRVAVTFDESARYFGRRARVLVTGLPVRPEVIAAGREEARAGLDVKDGRMLVLSFGGSQGARTINQAMIEVLKQLGGKPDLQFLHVAGPKQYEGFMDDLKKSGMTAEKYGNITIEPYLHRMPEALAAADLLICRAGAATIAELTVRGLPAILIPYPHAAANHQEHNARVLAERGAALMVLDRDLRGEMLAGLLSGLLENRPRLKAMSEKSLQLGRPGALDDILDSLAGLISRP
ncbi:MAG: undecaprenyldiphospho-muramoylpentapeptide beta-N-acetylglucosaminyltransferase [Bacillota bacterium]